MYIILGIVLIFTARLETYLYLYILTDLGFLLGILPLTTGYFKVMYTKMALFLLQKIAQPEPR